MLSINHFDYCYLSITPFFFGGFFICPARWEATASSKSRGLEMGGNKVFFFDPQGGCKKSPLYRLHLARRQ